MKDKDMGKGISRKSEYQLNPQKVRTMPVGAEAKAMEHRAKIKCIGRSAYDSRTGYGTKGV